MASVHRIGQCTFRRRNVSSILGSWEMATPWGESSSRQMLEESYICLGDIALLHPAFLICIKAASAGEGVSSWWSES